MGRKIACADEEVTCCTTGAEPTFPEAHEPGLLDKEFSVLHREASLLLDARARTAVSELLQLTWLTVRICIISSQDYNGSSDAELWQ